jgi:hypothetical protein
MLVDIAKAVLPRSWYPLFRDINGWSERFFGSFGHCLSAALANAFGASGATAIDEDGIRKRKRSDTIFIFGSGYSLNNLTADEWAIIENNDTMGFSYFVLQKYVRMDFHLIRELGLTSHDNNKRRYEWRGVFGAYGKILRANSRYKDTVFVVQGGWPAYAGNRFVGGGFLPPGAKLFRYRNGRRGHYPPARSFSEGLTHGPATVTDCVNFASVVGWRRIVLCGIDLYDRRYFWQAPGGEFFSIPGLTDQGGGEYSGEGDVASEHRTSEPMLKWASLWKSELAARGVALEVLNPKSRLASVLPVHRLAGEPAHNEPTFVSSDRAQ